MLTRNELKYVATKMAANPNLPIFSDFKGEEPISNKVEPGMLDKLKGFGKEYGGDIGMGAGAGAIAGIPIALLAHALMADPKNKGLRDYLKSGLLGALLGGGLGAVGGGMLRPNTRMNLQDEFYAPVADSMNLETILGNAAKPKKPEMSRLKDRPSRLGLV